MFKKGLYIVSLPIGNLKDISFRAKITLENSDYILCEDTRNSLKFLNFYKISKKLISFHRFNEDKLKDKIIKDLKDEKIISLIADAGTPTISDPGKNLITEVHRHKINIFPIPGASAPVAAYSVSGFRENFFFNGFIPKKINEANKLFKRLKKIDSVLIFFLPSRDLKKYQTIITNNFKGMEFFIAREITKIHETYIRDKVENMKLYLQENTKGELTLLIDNYYTKYSKNNPVDITREIKLLIDKMKSKDISEYLGNKYKLNKKIIYKKIIEIKNE